MTVFLLVASLIAFPALANDLTSIEMKKNADILRCYQQSPTGRAKAPAKVFIKLFVDHKGKPEKVREVSNREQTKDDQLLECVERKSMGLIYKAQAQKKQFEFQVKLVFP